MENKICLITGGNSGIGKESAVELAKMKSTIVILCRSRERGEEAVREIRRRSGNKRVELIVADLASQKSVRQAAETFKQRFSKLDVLINNAAVFLPTRMETEDGIEATFATNYLSHFLLTQLLLDLLEASGEGRIINVASKHNGIKMNFDDLMTTRKYAFYKAVGPTKLGLILFTKELARRLEDKPVTANSLHPGIIRTSLMKNMPWILRILFRFLSASPVKGAKTPVYLASSAEVKGVSGNFFVNCRPAKTTVYADNADDAKKLWDISMSLISTKS